MYTNCIVKRPNNFLHSNIDSPLQNESLTLPAANLETKAESFLLTLELPGVGKDSIHISTEDNILTISGEKRVDRAEDSEGFVLSERTSGKFTRRFRLGRSANSEKIRATYEDGVLTVEIPRSEESRKHAITIN